MEREYIKISKPTPFSNHTSVLKELDDEFWKNWIFYHLLTFYQNYDSKELKEKIETERKKSHPRVEREIAKYIRLKLNANREFGYNFKAFGENTNDEDVEGNYDITIHSTNWRSKDFYFECKNLDNSQDLVNKYVCYHKGHSIYDGGILRYFNGKYAQELNFGGMIGFILEGDTLNIKNKIAKKLTENLITTPQGDLLKISDNSINQNNFSFDSFHKRFDNEFIIHHLLFNFSQSSKIV
ncbi:hypothetical protein [Flavobacterium crassostreae]|uniref:Restriction endonuclease n=1 Tax=Flavobacterium crassostreae TaxID=1763534 RepID=A0A1B9E065_9FLAO|nr:hypothetical protein [Flavobacterium crassostreae]OCB75343.1 hypothetical protein LPBF_08075 [Flavobacterium crassostreae]